MDVEIGTPFFPVFAMKLIASFDFMCAKESCSFGYVQGMSEFMQENFGKQMKVLQDLI